ncbi:hypothetical protein R3P38DRAFT_2766089 [Favolaschia claudopus]|uniref:Uncharacterized protein n=1 Tax=Favolaschia claudopus TaxID=2862362 RepID=A0AAW0D036_9AGAR
MSSKLQWCLDASLAFKVNGLRKIITKSLYEATREATASIRLKSGGKMLHENIKDDNEEMKLRQYIRRQESNAEKRINVLGRHINRIRSLAIDHSNFCYITTHQDLNDNQSAERIAQRRREGDYTVISSTSVSMSRRSLRLRPLGMQRESAHEKSTKTQQTFQKEFIALSVMQPGNRTHHIHATTCTLGLNQCGGANVFNLNDSIDIIDLNSNLAFSKSTNGESNKKSLILSDMPAGNRTLCAIGYSQYHAIDLANVERDVTGVLVRKKEKGSSVCEALAENPTHLRRSAASEAQMLSDITSA